MAKRPRKARPAGKPPEKPSRRRMFSQAAALIGASGLLATVTGLVVTRSFDPLADRAADVVGASPLAVYDDGVDLDALAGTAFAFDHVLPPAAVGGPGESGAVTTRLIGEGAVPVGQVATAVTIENTRKETAVITSIKAKVSRRAVAPSAALVVTGGQGGPGEGPVELHFDFDGVDLNARTAGKQGRLGGHFLDDRGVTLAAQEKLRFNLIGHAADDLVEWTVQVGYVVNGESRTLELVPHGRPMRVTGASPSYGEAFGWDTTGLTREPVKKFCPVDCHDEIVAGGFN